MNSVPEIWKELSESLDFVCYEHKTKSEPYFIGYLSSLFDTQVLHRDILGHLTEDSNVPLDDLYNLITVAEKEISCDSKIIQNNILQGYVAVQLGLQNHHTILIKASLSMGRKVTEPQVEFTVEGSKDAFVESLDINLNLIRKRIPIPELRVKEITLGSASKAKVAVCYIEGTTNEQYVNTCIQRIEDVEFDVFSDITLLQQMIEDNSNSIFPQTVGTERRPWYVITATYNGVAKMENTTDVIRISLNTEPMIQGRK